MRINYFKLFLLTVIALAVICFCGCNQSEEKASDSTTSVTESSTAETQLPATEPSTAEADKSVTENDTENESDAEKITDVQNEESTTLSDVAFPITSKVPEGELKINKDGTWSYKGVYNLDLSKLSDKFTEVIPITMTGTGKYKVNSGKFEIDNASSKFVMTMTEKQISEFSFLIRTVLNKMNGSDLNSNCKASVKDGIITIEAIGNNGTDDYYISKHVLSAEESSAILG